MKILAINGSPRKGGNTAQCLEVVGKAITEAGIDFEVVQPGVKIHPCVACYGCNPNGKLGCVQADDAANEIMQKMVEADGIILASPVYYGGISGNMKCFLDRAFLCAGDQLHHKVGAAICTLRRSGGLETYQQLCAYLNSMEMYIATADYWNAVHGANIGECQQDTEGMEVMAKLGRNIAWITRVIDAAKPQIAPPETHKRTFTNFIR